MHMSWQNLRTSGKPKGEPIILLGEQAPMGLRPPKKLETRKKFDFLRSPFGFFGGSQISPAVLRLDTYIDFFY